MEKVIGEHRADVVMGDMIVELQGNYLEPEQIMEREAFYGPGLVWLYRAHWVQRVQPTRVGDGFEWRQGAPSMTFHHRPIWWQWGDQLVQVMVPKWKPGEKLSTFIPGRIITRLQLELDDPMALAEGEANLIRATTPPHLLARLP